MPNIAGRTVSLLSTALVRLATMAAMGSAGCVIQLTDPQRGAGGAAGSFAGDRAGDSGGQGGAPELMGSWDNVTNNVLELVPGTGDVMVQAHPTSDRVYVGTAYSGLLDSANGGESWKMLGTGSGSAPIVNYTTAFVFDPEHDERFWEVGIYGDSPYYTVDGGQTFVRLGQIARTDFLGVDFTDPERKTLLAGGHEDRRLALSRDGGKSWTDISAKLPSGSGWATRPLVLDAQTFLVDGCTGSSDCGVLRSTDGGESWTLVSNLGMVSGAPLVASDGTIYWVLAAYRGMVYSEDHGETWRMTSTGPTDLSTLVPPIELDDGRIVTLGMNSLLATSDRGKTWKPFGPPLPYRAMNCGIYGFTYSRALKRFFLNHNDCSAKIVMDCLFSAPLPE